MIRRIRSGPPGPPSTSRRFLRSGLAAALLSALLAAGLSLAGEPPASELSVSVQTSRGEFSMPCYRPSGEDSKPLVLLISGEGGWRRFDQQLARYVVEAGHWVGGLDAMRYFWRAQDDRAVLAEDVEAYARALARTAGRPADTPIILAGFSFGADLAPWIAGVARWRERLAGLILLGPDTNGSLQFRILEVLGFEQKDHIFPVADALRSSAGLPIVFIHGGADAESSAPELARQAPDPKKLLVVPGGDHHFKDHEAELRQAVHDGLQWLSHPSGSPSGAPSSSHD